MWYRYALPCAAAAAVLTATPWWCGLGAAQVHMPQPETVMIVLHAEPGSEADLANALARHWSAVRKLNLVQAAPHLTARATEEGNRTYFMETLTWRDSSIPDAAPASIQAIWAEMDRSVEARGGKPAIEIVPISIFSAPAAEPKP